MVVVEVVIQDDNKIITRSMILQQMDDILVPPGEVLGEMYKEIRELWDNATERTRT